MVKRKKRRKRRTNLLFYRGHFKWKNFLTLVLAIFLIGYGVNELRVIRINQEKIQSQPTAKQKFINAIRPEAQKMMQKHHVYASITMAQAILESNWGKSTLASRYHNLFGVKSEDVSNSKLLDTQEYENGQWVTISGRFQVYSSWKDSIDQHAALMVNGTSYNSAQYAQVVSATSYQTAAEALQTAGYATDPTYAQKLIKIIQKYNLNQYDS